MNKITENTIEKFAIELLEKRGRQYISPLHHPDVNQVFLSLGETKERVM